MSAADTVITFADHEGDFGNVWAAEAWCEARGLSVGSMQAGSPRGILFGDFAIAKWRNLNAAEKLALHGQMDGRRGTPVTVTIYGRAPNCVHEAVTAEVPA